MILLLHDLALNATNIQDLVREISLQDEREELLNLLESICMEAKEILIKGIAKAYENDYDIQKVKTHVTGQERTVAILACAGDTEGEAAMYRPKES